MEFWRKNRIIEAEKRYTRYIIVALFSGTFAFLTFFGMLGSLAAFGSVSKCSTGLVCTVIFYLLTRFFLKMADKEDDVISKLTYERR